MFPEVNSLVVCLLWGVGADQDLIRVNNVAGIALDTNLLNNMRKVPLRVFRNKTQTSNRGSAMKRNTRSRLTYVKHSNPLLMQVTILMSTLVVAASAQFLGFDRNDYPGDNSLKDLRKDFSYAGYWLNNPPGATFNSWAGKRTQLEKAGFGFLVLFNGRAYTDLRDAAHATDLGMSDALQAAEAARREGFPRHTIIFLDQEEGGRLLPEQKAYLFAWIDDVVQAGFGAGVYCSGLAAKEGSGASVVTADDIRQNAGDREIAFWVTNDACPPSPGCTTKKPLPRESGVEFAEVWQFAQSPKRKDVAAACSGYDSDGNCYGGAGAQRRIHLDLNTATSADPSHGRTR